MRPRSESGPAVAKPNVVFLIADQHRWDFMGYESNGTTHTPNLDRLAAMGTLFRRCYTTSPLCCPARQAIASGRYGMNTGCFTNLHQLPPGTPSFVGQLRDAGYHTVAVGKTVRSGNISLPVNVAVTKTKEGPRFSLTCGWNLRSF